MSEFGNNDQNLQDPDSPIHLSDPMAVRITGGLFPWHTTEEGGGRKKTDQRAKEYRLHVLIVPTVGLVHLVA